MDEFLLGLSLIAVLSVLARLLANLVHVPVILPLLLVGILIGDSVLGLVDPAELLGKAFIPFVKIAVAIILFEGALRLRRDELEPGIRPAVLRLVTLGVAITWVLGAIGVVLLLDLPHPISILIGAIVIVTGPTVVLPLLDFIEPPARVRSVLKWEGILIDPIGGILAVMIFGSLIYDGGQAAFDLPEFLLSVGTGLLAGGVFAALLIPVLASHRFSSRDKVAATVMIVIAAFAVSDAVFEDSGLVAAIVLGLILANQRRVNITYINEFKETLVPILIGILFVLLAANVELSEVVDLGLPGIALVVILVLVVRPLVVMTTIGLPFSWRERLFMATMSPRGIVAASTASAFGLVLTEQGIPGAEKVIPVTFLVIAGTVLFASISGPVVARFTGMAGDGPPALLMVGASPWAIGLAVAMRQAGAETWVWTVDEAEAESARGAGLGVMSDPLDLTGPDPGSLMDGISAVLLVSHDDSLNEMLGFTVSSALEPDQVFRLAPGRERRPMVAHAGRVLFGDESGFGRLEEEFGRGARFRAFPADGVPDQALPVASLTRSRWGGAPRILFGDPVRIPRRTGRTSIVALVPA